MKKGWQFIDLLEIDVYKNKKVSHKPAAGKSFQFCPYLLFLNLIAHKIQSPITSDRHNTKEQANNKKAFTESNIKKFSHSKAMSYEEEYVPSFVSKTASI